MRWLGVVILIGACGDSAPRPCAADPVILAETGENDRDGVWGTFAVDTRGVYYPLYNLGGVGDRGIARIPPEGGVREILWSGPETGLFGRGLAVDDRVYFYASARAPASGSSIWALPIEGGALQRLAEIGTAGTNSAIALDAENVYVTMGDQLIAVARTGGAPAVIASAPTAIRTMVASGGALYVLTDTELLKLGSDGELSTLAPTGGVDVAIDRANAYVLTSDSVLEVSLDSGEQTTVTTDLAGARSIAADTSGIYVSVGDMPPSSTGSVLWIPPGGAPQVLAQGVAAETIALDADSVYWAALGQVGRVDKCTE